MLKKLIMGGIISALFTAVALPAFASAQCPSNGGSTAPIVIAQNQSCSNTGSSANSNDVISKILSSLKNANGSNSIDLSVLKKLCSNTGNNANASCNGISPEVLNALQSACGSNSNCKAINLSALKNLCSKLQGCNINGISLSNCNSR